MHPDGIPQICGAHDGELPVIIKDSTMRGRSIPFVSLVKVTERAAFYKEPLVPSGRFNQSFHPSQR